MSWTIGAGCAPSAARQDIRRHDPQSAQIVAEGGLERSGQLGDGMPLAAASRMSLLVDVGNVT